MSESKGMSPGAMGILGMGLNMMATPPRAVPYSNAEIIGRSGQAGLGFYEKALEDKRKQQALDVSAEEHKLSREDRRQFNIDRTENMRATRANESLRITELNDWRKTQEDLKKEQADKLRRSEERAQEEVPLEILEDRNQDHMAGISWEDYKAAGYDKQDKASATKTSVVTDDDGNVRVLDTSKPGEYPGIGKKAKPGSGAKPSALTEKMALAEQALQDEHSRNNLVPSHGGNTAPPPMTKKFTTGEIAAKAEEMFGKKTAPGKLSSAGAGALARKGAAPGTAGKTRSVKMPDGSIWYFDAAGNRVR
jgi:hypothetical protein